MTRKRERLATGIYRDKFGIAIVISVQGHPREFRKDKHDVPYATRGRAWLIAERTALKKGAKLETTRQIAKGQTFAADVDRYLRTISSPGHLKNLKGIFSHYWTNAFGDMERNDVTELQVQEAFAGITGKEPSTLNHIRHALGSFYKAMNGPTGYNPARVLRKVREEYHDARAIPYDIINTLLRSMQDSPTKARLMVMAYTGLPQAQIARIEPHDLKLDAKTLYVRPRRKGAGVKGRTIPLSDDAVTALTFFQKQQAFGTFQNKQLQQTFNSAIVRSGVSVPPGARPYDLRHSFLTEVYRYTGDLRAVAELGMHATLEQTSRYATGAVSERATKAVAALPRILKHGTPPNAGNPKESKGVGVESSQRGKTRRKR